MDTTQLFYAASKKLQLYEGKKKKLVPHLKLLHASMSYMYDLYMWDRGVGSNNL